MSLAIHHDSQARQFEAELSGQRAVLAYRLDNAVMSIEHIAVPAPIDGQGVAAALMEAALAQARARGWQVDPVCPYARDIMRQHPGYAELLRNSIPASEHAAPEGAADEARRQHESALLDEALDESFPASDPPAVGNDH